MRILLTCKLVLIISLAYSQKRPVTNATIAKEIIKKDSFRIINSLDTFQSVKICNQIWMKKNLEVVTYRNGDTIPYVWGMSGEWANLKTGAWCYNSFVSAHRVTFGKFYNWYAINDPRGLAPVGWHIPSDAEWDTLVKCLDPNAKLSCVGCAQSAIAGGAMKESGTANWFTTQGVVSGTNSSGFTGLPGGMIQPNGIGNWMGRYGYFWTSTQFSNDFAFYRNLNWSNYHIDKDKIPKTTGFSVRCIKD